MNLKIGLSLFIISLLLTGCSNKPEDAVNNLFDGIKEGDYLKVSRNTNDKVAAKFSLTALKNCSVDKKKYKDDFALMHDCLVEEYAGMKVKNIDINLVSETEAKAKITVENKSEEMIYIFKVLKIEEKWKVWK